MLTIANVKQEAEELAPQLVVSRRDFHQHPELGFKEVRTSGVVAQHLHGLGLEVTTGVGVTGVVALVEADGLAIDAPTVLLRFDMDTLPIEEVSDAPYASVNPGVMHTCGHDGHTAIGMGVAQLLSRHRNELPGRVKLVFQPAEEGLGGTAHDGCRRRAERANTRCVVWAAFVEPVASWQRGRSARTLIGPQLQHSSS